MRDGPSVRSGWLGPEVSGHHGQTDPAAARAAGAARLERHQAGGKLGLGDALIAAVARGLEATIVTRNRPDFERQGASVLTY